MSDDNKFGRQPELIDVTPEQLAARKRRNIAIGLCLFAMVAIFYGATFTKFKTPAQHAATASQENN